MSKFKTVWFWDSGVQLSDKFNHIISFFDDSHPKPSMVRDSQARNHLTAHSFSSLDADGNILVCMVSDDFEDAAPLWYVYIEDTAANPPTRSVVAYADGKFSNGTVIQQDDAFRMGVKYSDSVGFIRWFLDGSRMQQIFVSENHRRRKISTRLIGAADMLIVSDRNWNGSFLSGGDITTNDGESLRSAWTNSTRLLPRQGSAT